MELTRTILVCHPLLIPYRLELYVVSTLPMIPCQRESNSSGTTAAPIRQSKGCRFSATHCSALENSQPGRARESPSTTMPPLLPAPRPRTLPRPFVGLHLLVEIPSSTGKETIGAAIATNPMLLRQIRALISGCAKAPKATTKASLRPTCLGFRPMEDLGFRVTCSRTAQGPTALVSTLTIWIRIT